MCGIFGYIGPRDPQDIVLTGLRSLEYRGYDSWGIAMLTKSGLVRHRAVGRIGQKQAEKKVARSTLGIGIGHTRWATHGKVSIENAHPHLSSDGKIALVHNGIIENYQVLKSVLEEDGFKFSSETDSEVLANLISKCYKGKLDDAVREALAMVEGTYGILAMHQNEQLIVAARKGSPLLLGLGEGELFIASDASPIVPFTKRVVYFDDGDVAVLSREGYRITTLQNEILDKEIAEITWSVAEIERKGYKHFMLKEIMEQPQTIENAMRGRIRGPHFGGLNLPEGFLSSLHRVIITGCGTSWHAGLVGEYLIESIARVRVEVEYASEFRYRDPLVDEHDLVIVISQSGETADTLAALREAKRKGAKAIGIVNVVGSTIARESGGGIYLHAGPEIGVASTKAFTSQIVALYLFAILLAKERKVISETDADSFLEDLALVPKLMERALSGQDSIRNIAETLAHTQNALYLGRGVNFPVALEGALKLKEISYIHAEGYPAAEMKHGPIALIDERMPVIFVAPRDSAFEKMKSNMQEVKARGGRIIAIATDDEKELLTIADHCIFIPKVRQELSPLLTVLPLQLLAYHIADLRGCDIDKPRNLAKSVTVE